MRAPSLKFSLILTVAMVIAAAVFLTVLLTRAKFESHVFALVEDRLAIVLEEAAEPVRLALGLGLGLGEMADLDAVLGRARPAAAEGIALAVVDARDVTIARVPATPLPQLDLTLEAPLQDGFGRPAGRITLTFQGNELDRELAEVGRGLERRGLLVAALAAGLALPGLWVASRRLGPLIGHADDDAAHAAATRRLTWWIVLVAGGLLLAGAVAISITAWRGYSPIIAAELDAQADTLSAGLQRQIDRGLTVGIPIDRLVGVEALFAEELEATPGIAFLAVADASGEPLYWSGIGRQELVEALSRGDGAVRLIEAPLAADGERLGTLWVGVPADYAREVGLDLLIDVVSVLAVSCLLGVELLLFVVNRSHPAAPVTPTGQPGRPPVKAVLVRLPILLFALGEELSRPFLPLFARELAGPAPWISEDLATALPITLFMLVWALSQPWGAAWSERAGRRRIFLIGAVAAAGGLAATATADSLAALLAYRVVAAIGYGLVLIGAQGLIIDNTPPAERAMGMATLVGGLLAAAVCGPVLGGVIAEQLGPRWAFAGGAGLAVLSMLVLVLAVSRDAGAPRASEATRIDWGEALRLLGTARFAALMAFSAVPTKLAATALLFYLIPLTLAGTGAGPADIGRVQTLYFVAFILGAPAAAWLSDKTGKRRAFLAWGGIGTLLATVPLAFGGSLPLAAVSMGLFGIAQSLISAPQLALVGDVARSGDRAVPESLVIAIFRLVERMGAMIAPALAAGLAMAYGYRAALIGVGVITATAAIVFLLVFREHRGARPAQEIAEAP